MKTSQCCLPSLFYCVRIVLGMTSNKGNKNENYIQGELKTLQTPS